MSDSWLSHDRLERFIRAWQAASTVAEAAKEYGCSLESARQYASRLRRAGVPIKRFSPRNVSPPDFKALAKLAKELAR